MIEESVKVHDKFSIEMKIGFNVKQEQKISDFAINTWFFIPNSLDINPLTYEKKDFYRDLKSNIRLITPVYKLADIASGPDTPLLKLEDSIRNLSRQPSRHHAAEYEYHIKMFLTILKSALRNATNLIGSNKDKDEVVYQLSDYIDHIETISRRYRALNQMIDTPAVNGELGSFYSFGDEFMINVMEQHSFKLLKLVSRNSHPGMDELKQRLLQSINREIRYKKEHGYLVVEENEPKGNRELIFRLGMLKKFAENELFLTTDKKKDGILIEQVYYSIAAGLSMIFATAIAFSVQQKYGNFTMPFFVALVVSYMLKDRIKELGRYYFGHRLVRRYFDNKIMIRLKDNVVGWSKEAMDFIAEPKVPQEVIRIRDRSLILEANNRSFSERIILYRRLVRIYRNTPDTDVQYESSGINDIIRFNVSSLLTKMDNPNFPLFVVDEKDEVKVIKGERTYYLNLIMQLKHEEQLEYRRYRIALNRKGILHVERFNKK
jgi:hypothetical protein